MHDGTDLDLGLLSVFMALHEERHLTRAARRVGLSQPAMSRALVRLRARFDDPLFVRTARGMTPTPRADALAPQVADLLARLHGLMRPVAFDPRTLTRRFTIGSADFLETELLPRAAALLAAEAPRASIVSRPLGADPDALAAGRLDLIVSVRANIPSDAMVTHLFDDDFVCVVRTGHPVVRRGLSLAQYTALPHVLISPTGAPGSLVDDALHRLGLSRHIGIYTTTFLAAPLIVAQSDLILTGPQRVLIPMARQLGLRVLAPPVDLQGFSIHMAWHPRMQHDSLHAWLRGLIKRAAPAAARRTARPRGRA